jgi:DNA-binding MarR family transcriptional regulator
MPRTQPRLIFQLNVAQRALDRWIEARSRSVGGTAARSGLLFLLEQRDGQLISEAGQALGATASTMSGLVDRMEAAGMIERRPEPNDGRAARLWLSDHGRAALAEMRPILVQINARLLDGFTDEEAAVVSRWLGAVRQRFGDPEA